MGRERRGRKPKRDNWPTMEGPGPKEKREWVRNGAQLMMKCMPFSEEALISGNESMFDPSCFLSLSLTHSFHLLPLYFRCEVWTLNSLYSITLNRWVLFLIMTHTQSLPHPKPKILKIKNFQLFTFSQIHFPPFPFSTPKPNICLILGRIFANFRINFIPFIWKLNKAFLIPLTHSPSVNSKAVTIQRPFCIR